MTQDDAPQDHCGRPLADALGSDPTRDVERDFRAEVARILAKVLSTEQAATLARLDADDAPPEVVELWLDVTAPSLRDALGLARDRRRERLTAFGIAPRPVPPALVLAEAPCRVTASPAPCGDVVWLRADVAPRQAGAGPSIALPGLAAHLLRAQAQLPLGRFSDHEDEGLLLEHALPHDATVERLGAAAEQLAEIALDFRMRLLALQGIVGQA